MSMKDWAAWYAKQGFDVFPVHRPVKGKCSCGDADCESVGKHPVPRDGVKSAASSQTKVEYWWDETDWNIGLHCNKVTVLDVDGEEGKEEIRRLVIENDAVATFSKRPRASTGGGGYHFFFKRSPAGNKVKFRPGLDIRSEGGYIVAPPSLHSSGTRYSWDVTLADGVLAPMPQWLLELANGKSKLQITTRDGPRPTMDIHALGEITKGGRNHEMARLCGRLYWEGKEGGEVLGLMHAINSMCCSPPLKDREVAHIVESVGRYH